MAAEPSSASGSAGRPPAPRTARPSGPPSHRWRTSASCAVPVSTSVRPGPSGSWSRCRTCGRRRSASTRVTRSPARARETASSVATVVAPSPGSAPATTTTRGPDSLPRCRRATRRARNASAVGDCGAAPVATGCRASSRSAKTRPMTGAPVACSTSSTSRTVRSSRLRTSTDPMPSTRPTAAPRHRSPTVSGLTGVRSRSAGCRTSIETVGDVAPAGVSSWATRWVNCWARDAAIVCARSGELSVTTTSRTTVSGSGVTATSAATSRGVRRTPVASTTRSASSSERSTSA